MELTKERNVGDFQYAHAFQRWDEVAAVRSKPLRVMSPEESKERIFFTPELVPILAHPLVTERGPEAMERMLIYQLYAHLDFTENLEHEVVNKVAYQIGRGNLSIELPPSMIVDAWKLYVDEAYHFMFSADLLKQVADLTDVRPLRNVTPAFYLRLQKIVADLPQELADLVFLFFAIISETLITGTLSVVPRDERVVQTVRDVIWDHAEDESRHHAYFANLLQFVWDRLPKKEQRTIGVLLPELMLGYLQPDTQVVRRWLQEFRFPHRQIERILEESYPVDKVLHHAREAGKVTMKHLEKQGVFENECILEAFGKHQLLVTK